MNKSIEIAKNESPDGKIKSTTIVVYAYPEIGGNDRSKRQDYRS